MLPVAVYRQAYGRVFCTSFPSGLDVPWKLLPIGEYIKYAQEIRRGIAVPSELEDEIFDKCVQDKVLVEQRPFLAAGVVATISSNIWQHSGPTGIESFNDDLEFARQEITGSEEAVLHDLVQVITLAFPYKPEEVYEMSYDTMLLRVAQAEKKLIQTGMMEEPVKLFDKNADKQKAPKPKIDLRKAYEQQKGGELARDIANPAPLPQDIQREKWWEVSPILETKNKKKIDFNQERKMIEQGPAAQVENKAGQMVTESTRMSSMANADQDIARAEMVERAKVIYGPLIQKLNEQRKLPKK